MKYWDCYLRVTHQLDFKHLVTAQSGCVKQAMITCPFLKGWTWCALHAVMSGVGQVHFGRREEVRGTTTWRRREAVQAVTVPGPTAFSAVAVDGSLQLSRRTESFLLTFIWVQVLHIPTNSMTSNNQHTVQLILQHFKHDADKND